MKMKRTLRWHQKSLLAMTTIQKKTVNTNLGAGILLNNAIEHHLNVIDKDKVMFCDPKKPLMITNCQDGVRHDLTHKKETNVFTSSICMLSE